MHAFLLRALGSPDARREEQGFLYRVERVEDDGIVVLVQRAKGSKDDVNAATLADVVRDASLQPVLDRIEVGARFQFRILANVTKKIDTKSKDGVRRHGRRVPLLQEEQQLAWLVSKSHRHGFSLISTRIRASGTAALGVREGCRIAHRGVLFDGELTVTDVEAMSAALQHGIGPGKAYGFGLLSLAPADA